MLSVKEIGNILAEPLRECGATAAYLGGGYVRADRNGDISRGDELFLFVESEGLLYHASLVCFSHKFVDFSLF